MVFHKCTLIKIYTKFWTETSLLVQRPPALQRLKQSYTPWLGVLGMVIPYPRYPYSLGYHHFLGNHSIELVNPVKGAVAACK